jgi:hypothetical protein
MPGVDSPLKGRTAQRHRDLVPCRCPAVRAQRLSKLILAAAFAGCFFFFGLVAPRGTQDATPVPSWQLLRYNTRVSMAVSETASVLPAVSISPSPSVTVLDSRMLISAPEAVAQSVHFPGWSAHPTACATPAPSSFPSQSSSLTPIPTPLGTSGTLSHFIASAALPNPPHVLDYLDAARVDDGRYVERRIGNAVPEYVSHTSVDSYPPDHIANSHLLVSSIGSPATASSASSASELERMPDAEIGAAVLPGTAPLSSQSFIYTANFIAPEVAEADGCSHVLVDLKSHSAAAARWLFMPATLATTAARENSVTLSAFDPIFGPLRSRRRTSCAFLFERDSAFRAALTELQGTFNWNGWRTTFHTAVGLLGDRSSGSVEVLDVAAVVQWLLHHVTKRRVPPPDPRTAFLPVPLPPAVILKLDASVPGTAELILALKDTGILCSIAALLIEHVTPDSVVMRRAANAGCSATRILALPDEETRGSGSVAAMRPVLAPPWERSRSKRAGADVIEDFLQRESWGFLGVVGADRHVSPTASPAPVAARSAAVARTRPHHEARSVLPDANSTRRATSAQAASIGVTDPAIATAESSQRSASVVPPQHGVASVGTIRGTSATVAAAEDVLVHAATRASRHAGHAANGTVSDGAGSSAFLKRRRNSDPRTPSDATRRHPVHVSADMLQGIGSAVDHSALPKPLYITDAVHSAPLKAHHSVPAQQATTHARSTTLHSTRSEEGVGESAATAQLLVPPHKSSIGRHDEHKRGRSADVAEAPATALTSDSVSNGRPRAGIAKAAHFGHQESNGHNSGADNVKTQAISSTLHDTSHKAHATFFTRNSDAGHSVASVVSTSHSRSAPLVPVSSTDSTAHFGSKPATHKRLPHS